MEIPSHYRPVYRLFIRFSLVMMVVALLMGIAFQESAKKAPISATLPAGMHLEAIITLALVHGHAFLIGVLLPLSITWISYLSLALGFTPLTEKTWNWVTRLYLPGSALAVLLMLYKGYAILLGVRGGETDLTVIDHHMFFGSHALRAASYGLVHTAMAVGVFIFVGALWKSMKKPAN